MCVRSQQEGMTGDLQGCCWQQLGRSWALQLPCPSGGLPCWVLHRWQLLQVQRLLPAEQGHGALELL